MVDPAVMPPGAAHLKRDEAGQWLCSTDGCSNVATSSWSQDCTACVDYATAMEARADEQRVAAAELEERHSTALAAYSEALDEEKPSRAAEIDALRMQHRQAQRDEQRLRATAKTHAEPHTHPVFACDDHANGEG